MDRNPPQLDEFTVCEEGALLKKVRNWDDFSSFVASGVPMDRLIVPLNVDLTKADGRPSERINETNPTAVITTADGAAPKRMRVLPTVGPQFVATDQPHSIVEGVLRTAQSALLKRWPSLQNLLDTTSRLLGYFSSSFTHYSSLHKSPTPVVGPRRDVPVTRMAWHDRLMIFAVAHRQDAVYLYDMDASRWHSTYLTDQRQRQISCLQWQPCSGKFLAVGCRDGVCLWRVSSINGEHVDESSQQPVLQPTEKSLPAKLTKMQLVDRLLSAETRMTLLSVPGVTQVSCLSFSPCGRFLAVGSAVNGSLVVWDMDWQQPTLIRRMASGTLELAFSPDGLYLLVSQQSSRHENSAGVLRIFETQSWSDAVIEYPAICRNLNWFPRANGFLFSEQGKCEIHIIRLDKAFPSLSYHFEKVEKFPQKFFTMDDGELSCGGVIDKIALSPSGNRLIVSFESYNPRSAGYLLVLSVKSFGPALLNREAFMEMGYIHGPLPLSSDETSTLPVVMSFAPSFQHGALLAISWENGRISFIPFFFAREQPLPQFTTHPIGSTRPAASNLMQSSSFELTTSRRLLKR